ALAKRRDLLRGEHRLHGPQIVYVAAVMKLRQDTNLLLKRGIADLDLEEEPVELRLGEPVRPLLFDRVLRGDDEERTAELVGHSIDGDLAFLHHLEECRLSLGGRAVDLVDQDEVAEDRTMT